MDPEQREAQQLARLVRDMLALTEMVDGLADEHDRWDELSDERRSELVELSRLAWIVNDEIIEDVERLGY